MRRLASRLRRQIDAASETIVYQQGVLRSGTHPEVGDRDAPRCRTPLSAGDGGLDQPRLKTSADRSGISAEVTPGMVPECQNTPNTERQDSARRKALHLAESLARLLGVEVRI